MNKRHRPSHASTFASRSKRASRLGSLAKASDTSGQGLEEANSENSSLSARY